MKFTIGDRVRHTKYGTSGKVLEIDPNRGVYVMWDNGTSAYYENGDGIVKNAVCNYTPYSDFEKGDVVRYKDSIHDADHDATYTVVSVSGHDLIVKDKIGKVSRDFEGSFEIVKSVRNAVAHHAFKVGDYVGMRGAHPSADVKMRIVKIDGDKITVDGNDTFDARELHHWANSCRNSVVANALALKRGVVCNADVVPEIKAEYDRYLKAKAKFHKWWNPNRRFSEAGKETRELNDATEAVWKKWRQAFGKPIPSGWAMHPELLKVAPNSTNSVVNAALAWKAQNSVSEMHDEMRRIYLDRAATAGKMGDIQAAEDWRRKAWEIERDE